jgi:acyl-CoA synthetase (AMP-forming)/AMP-acid ligase II
VPLTHANLLASARNIAMTLVLTPDDRCLNIMPLFHIHGLVGGLLASLVTGGSVVCPPAFHAPQFFDWLKEFGPTWYSAVPTMHQAILGCAQSNLEIIRKHPLRFIRSSSAAMPARVMEDLENIFGSSPYRVGKNSMKSGLRTREI